MTAHPHHRPGSRLWSQCQSLSSAFCFLFAGLDLGVLFGLDAVFDFAADFGFGVAFAFRVAFGFDAAFGFGIAFGFGSVVTVNPSL